MRIVAQRWGSRNVLVIVKLVFMILTKYIDAPVTWTFARILLKMGSREVLPAVAIVPTATGGDVTARP